MQAAPPLPNLPVPDMAYLRRVLLEMLAIPCPTGYTDGIVRYVAGQLDTIGVPYELTRRGTIRGTLKGRRSSPDRAIGAHLDTIGAMVRNIRADGRLELAPVGTWSARFAEGSRVSILGDRGHWRGCVLPLKASGHAFNNAVDELPIGWDYVEVRIDAHTRSRAETEALGIAVGDFVAFDPMPEFTESGYICSRHLDNKAGAAALLAALQAIVSSGQALAIDCHPVFTITEEIGSGAAAALQLDVAEFVSVDIAPAAAGQATSEYAVSIGMQDSGGPYDYHLSRHLLALAERFDLRMVRDVFRFYHSDAQSAVMAGRDTRTALIAFGADATHGYERTHEASLFHLARLLCAYVLSAPVFASDGDEEIPLQNFEHQLADRALSANDTVLPTPAEVLAGNGNAS